MSKRKNPRRTAALLARNFQLDSESNSENENDMEMEFIHLMKAALSSRRRSTGKNIKRNNTKNKKNQGTVTGRPKSNTRPYTKSATEIINVGLDSDHQENISETVKDNVEKKVDTFFKSNNLLSDDDDDLFITKANSPKPNKASKDFYTLPDSDEEVASTSVTKPNISISTINNIEDQKNNKDDELMEIVDKILDSEDIPVDTSTEPDNWNEFKSKTEEILQSVNVLLDSCKEDKSNVKPIEEAPEEKSVKSKPICPICLEVLGGNTIAGSTVCGHIFCLECIKRVAQSRKTCPTCRKHINKKQVHPLYL